MKKTWIWVVLGIVLIALIVGGYFYLKSSADVVSGTNSGSTDVTMTMDVDYNYAVLGQDAVARITITNNTSQPIKYMKAYIPSASPTSIAAKYQNYFASYSFTKQTNTPVIGLNGHSVDSAKGGWIYDKASNGYFPIESAKIATSGSYKVFPVAGYPINSKGKIMPAIPAKSATVLSFSFQKSFNSSPVTVTASPKMPGGEGLLVVEIAKTQAVTEKTMKLYVPKNIGTANSTFPNRYVILNYDNKQDIAVPVSNTSVLDGFEYDSTANGYTTVISKTGSVDVPHSLNKTIGDFITFPIYPMSTVPALAKGEKYSIPIDYIKSTNTDGAVTLTANPTNIKIGESSTLTWTNANANCYASTFENGVNPVSSGWFDPTKANGSAVVKPTLYTVYQLSCNSTEGDFQASSVAVFVSH